jgi:ribose 5-phosphate isomerase B
MEQSRQRQFETIYLASDHAGFALKEEVKSWLTLEQFIVIDGGATSFDGEDDFPDYIIPAVRAMVDDTAGRAAAVVFGGSGQGEAMAANRVRGARAVVYYGSERRIPVLGREHNDANVLSIGARFVSSDEAKWAIWEWLHTELLPDAKYQRRNDALDT